MFESTHQQWYDVIDGGGNPYKLKRGKLDYSSDMFMSKIKDCLFSCHFVMHLVLLNAVKFRHVTKEAAVR